MGFSCPLCREEWLILTTKGLCPRCERIRFIMASYGREPVIQCVEKVFLIDKFREKESGNYIKDDEGKWKLKEEVD